MSLLGYGLVGVGIVAFAFGSYLNRWHNKQFQEHMDRIEEYSREGKDDAVSREIQRFGKDDKITRAIDAMVFCHMGGITMIGMGIFYLVS